MAKKKKSKFVLKPWCWYCEREFEDEKVLMQHQQAKHYKCRHCPRKLNTAGGLAVHIQQVHKLEPEKIQNALPGRDGGEVEIFGMEGIPKNDAEEWKRRKEAEAGVTSSASQPQAKRPRVEKKAISEDDLAAQLAAHRALMSGSSDSVAGPSTPSTGVSGTPVIYAAPQTYSAPPVAGAPPAVSPPGPPGAPFYPGMIPPGMPPPPFYGAPPPGLLPPGAPMPPFPPGMVPPPGIFPPGMPLPPPGAALPPMRFPGPNGVVPPFPPGMPVPPLSALPPGVAPPNPFGAPGTPGSLPTPVGTPVPPSGSVTPGGVGTTQNGSDGIEATVGPLVKAVENAVNPALKAGTVLIWEDPNYSPAELRAQNPKYAFKAVPIESSQNDPSVEPPVLNALNDASAGDQPRGTKRARAEDFL